ncbi:MAG: nucleotidyltransferase family protein [Euryarchaeota archaeon]|nr:nucleotidyltransferase family protein [Euryarchaeota archaeon]
MPACVVLAAGASLRSGAVPKALLPLRDGRSVLHHVLRTAEGADLTPLWVVVGARAEEVRREVEGTRATSVVHHGWERGRTGSVKRGLGSAGEGHGGTLLWPVDHPFVSNETLRVLSKATSRTAGPDAPAEWLIPLYRGRRGHPVVVGDGARREVLSFPDDVPLFRYPRSHPSGVLEIPVDDPGVVENIDTPAAFAAAVARCFGGGP